LILFAPAPLSPTSFERRIMLVVSALAYGFARYRDWDFDGWLKDFRRIATRQDRNAVNFLAAVCDWLEGLDPGK
jgi:hypothetical protein